MAGWSMAGSLLKNDASTGPTCATGCASDRLSPENSYWQSQWHTGRVTRWLAVGVMACLGLSASGCRPKANPETLALVRNELALDRNQVAIEKLNGVPGADASYLRAIAMTRQGLESAAAEQIALAMSSDSGNARYPAFELRMKVLNKVPEVEANAKALVEVCRPRMSDAAVALMAATGYGAQRLGNEAMESYRTAVSLADQIPEFWPEMLNMAISMQDLKTAESLLNKMSEVDPDEMFVRRQRVLVLSGLGRHDDALQIAQELYTRNEQSIDLAMLLAQVLQAAPATPERELEFADLVSRHSTHVPLTILYGHTLARRGQLPKAITLLNQLLPKLPVEQRGALLPVLVGLPLEAGDAALAEAQLTLHRVAINQPALTMYYEGRIRFLQKRYVESAKALASVVKSLRQMKSPPQQLLDESLFWMGKATFDANVEARINQAIDAAGSSGKVPEAVAPASAPAETAPAETAPAPAAGPVQSEKPAETAPEKPAETPAGKSPSL
jgi:tetratricopeptide (TPR) repeat protein